MIAIGAMVAALAVVALFAWRAAGKGPAFAPVSHARRAWPALNGWSIPILACGVLGEIGTQAWYLVHEWRSPAPRIRWELAAPSDAWRPLPIPARVEAVLRNSRVSGLGWSDPVSAIRAWVFVVSWEGSASQKEDPEWHDPTICLPSAGLRQVADLGVFPLRLGGVTLAFTGYRFATEGPPLDVFFCHWDASVAESRSEGDELDLRIRRLHRVRDGRRGGAVAHLFFEIQAPDDAAALAWLESWAPRLLRPCRL
jgi:hypothetical protein